MNNSILNASDDKSTPIEIVDFSEAIDRLDKKAKKSRRRVTFIGGLLIVSVVLLVFIIMYSVQIGRLSQIDFAFRSASRTSVEEPIVRRVTTLMESLIGPSPRSFSLTTEKFIPPPPSEVEKIKSDLNKALEDLERAVKIADIGKQPGNESSGLTQLIASSVFSLGGTREGLGDVVH